MSNFVSPSQQAMNIIRFIGDNVIETGEPIGSIHSQDFFEAVDAPSGKFAAQLMKGLFNDDLVTGGEPIDFLTGETTFISVNLTLKGWERYESESRGEFMGSYGFLAMQFNDSNLEAFVEEILKPAIEENTEFDLIDMNDVSEAGLIDNIMRVRIRDSRFVIADLSHDNNGAYWEAGYAEGLGKPVIYICEQEKFDLESTHFDTNHCTTVPWSWSEAEQFKEKLLATLKRSLDTSQ